MAPTPAPHNAPFSAASTPHSSPPPTPPLAACRSTLDQWLLYDAMRAQLLDPEFANDTVHFMELQVDSCAPCGQLVAAVHTLTWQLGPLSGAPSACMVWAGRLIACRVSVFDARQIAHSPCRCRCCLPACLQARWLVGLLQRGPEAAKQAFSVIPESVVRDMTAWLRWAGGGGWLGGWVGEWLGGAL